MLGYIFILYENPVDVMRLVPDFVLSKNSITPQGNSCIAAEHIDLKTIRLKVQNTYRNLIHIVQCIEDLKSPGRIIDFVRTLQNHFNKVRNKIRQCFMSGVLYTFVR